MAIAVATSDETKAETRRSDARLKTGVTPAKLSAQKERRARASALRVELGTQVARL